MLKYVIWPRQPLVGPCGQDFSAKVHMIQSLSTSKSVSISVDKSVAKSVAKTVVKSVGKSVGEANVDSNNVEALLKSSILI